MGLDMVAEHDVWQRRAGTAGRSRDLRTGLLRRLARDLGPLDAVSAAGLEDWLGGLGVCTSSRATYLVQIRGFYRWAVRAGLLSHDPTVGIPVPRVPRRVPRPLDPVSVSLAVELAPRPVGTWIVLGAYGGLRCCEIAPLRGEDLRDGWLYVVGKGGHQRMIPAPLQVVSALGTHPATGALWDEDAATVSRVGNQWLRRLGAGGTMHQLRHTFATRVYDQTGDLLVTQQLLGHASPATTAIYAQVSGARLRDAVAATFGRAA
jgi:integrase/recombinase XerC